MNKIPDKLKNFDFNWSACAFEHLGSIKNGINFIINQMKTLKKGGWAFHSSEYNVGSNDKTAENQTYVIFRQKDYEEIRDKLTKLGHHVEYLDFSIGNLPNDWCVDTPPYELSNVHLKLQIE